MRNIATSWPCITFDIGMSNRMYRMKGSVNYNHKFVKPDYSEATNLKIMDINTGNSLWIDDAKILRRIIAHASQRLTPSSKLKDWIRVEILHKWHPVLVKIRWYHILGYKEQWLRICMACCQSFWMQDSSPLWCMQINCFFDWLLLVPSTSIVTSKETSAIGENFDHSRILNYYL